jgi:membrane protease YdiL (CAAX protease family)
VPRNAGERRSFIALAITAGVCEELLYRGFLLWYLAPFAGLAGAVAVGTLVFGLAHAYQGPRNAGRAAIAGLAHWGIYLATGSIVPGMVLHAAIDLDSMALLGRAFPPETTGQAIPAE